MEKNQKKSHKPEVIVGGVAMVTALIWTAYYSGKIDGTKQTLNALFGEEPKNPKKN